MQLYEHLQIMWFVGEYMNITEVLTEIKTM